MEDRTQKRGRYEKGIEKDKKKQDKEVKKK